MTPAETIQTAIEKLTALRDRPDIERQFTVNVDQETAEWFLRIKERVERDKRTIDAQLAILGSAVEQFNRNARVINHDEPAASGMAVDLARAILGDQVDA